MGKLIVDLVAATQTEEWLYDRTNMLLNDREERTRLLREAVEFISHQKVCLSLPVNALNREPCSCGATALLAEIREAVGDA